MKTIFIKALLIICLQAPIASIVACKQPKKIDEIKQEEKAPEFVLNKITNENVRHYQFFKNYLLYTKNRTFNLVVQNLEQPNAKPIKIKLPAMKDFIIDQQGFLIWTNRINGTFNFQDGASLKYHQKVIYKSNDPLITILKNPELQTKFQIIDNSLIKARQGDIVFLDVNASFLLYTKRKEAAANSGTTWVYEFKTAQSYQILEHKILEGKLINKQKKNYVIGFSKSYTDHNTFYIKEIDQDRNSITKPIILSNLNTVNNFLVWNNHLFLQEKYTNQEKLFKHSLFDENNNIRMDKPQALMQYPHQLLKLLENSRTINYLGNDKFSFKNNDGVFTIAFLGASIYN